MRIIGIDPAPSKRTTICDPSAHENTFRDVKPTDLADVISEFTASDERTLICWDAPLTGPSLGANGTSGPGSEFSQRPIESFFGKSHTSKAGHSFGTQQVKGISVLPYSGCPHWAITQAMFGYPKTSLNGHAAQELPWELQTQAMLSLNGRPKKIVEVHPALALWLMQPEDKRHKLDFTYKGRNSTVKARAEAKECLFHGLRRFVREDADTHTVVDQFEAHELSDDNLDGLTGWVLGTLWSNNTGMVRLLGDAANGTFLLPVVEGLEESYSAFVGK